MKHAYKLVWRDTSGTCGREVLADNVTIMDNGSLIFWASSPKRALLAVNFGNWLSVEKVRDL